MGVGHEAINTGCLCSLSSSWSPVLLICLCLHWMSDVLPELWRLKRDARACQLTSLPGMVSACCYQWVVTPSFRLPPLLCLCLMVPVSASGWRPGESHPRVLCIKAWWMCLSGWGFRPARVKRCCPPPDRHPEAWPHYTVLAFQHGFQSVSAPTSFPPFPFCVAASELRNI